MDCIESSLAKVHRSSSHLSMSFNWFEYAPYSHHSGMTFSDYVSNAQMQWQGMNTRTSSPSLSFRRELLERWQVMTDQDPRLPCLLGTLSTYKQICQVFSTSAVIACQPSQKYCKAYCIVDEVQSLCLSSYELLFDWVLLFDVCFDGQDYHIFLYHMTTWWYRYVWKISYPGTERKWSFYERNIFPCSSVNYTYLRYTHSAC